MSHTLPPHRELPPEVRGRMRATVRAGIPPRRGRALVAGTAVIVLVAGVLVGAQFFRSSAPVPAGSAGVDDRCWAAIESAGKTGQVPPREEWRTTGSRALGDDVVTSYLAGGRPVFCETTATTVTVSDPAAEPAYAAGSRTGLLLYTGTGLAAGVADPSWPRIELSLPDGLGITVEPVTPETGVLTAFTATDPATTTLWAGMSVQGQQTRPGPRVELPPAPAPLVSVIDRPGDRTSPAGRALGECLAALPAPPTDADGYQPGSLLEHGPYRVVLGQRGAHDRVRDRSHRVVAAPRRVPRHVDPGPQAVGARAGREGAVRRPCAPVGHEHGRRLRHRGGRHGAGRERDVRGVAARRREAGVPRHGEAWVRVQDARGAALYNGSAVLR
ncbi:hypothetical protein [Amycolatopsis methanolica]|uniref:Uncharacterized protein n=1 Tax=Amycolatopsis methanolica 239 TaxID=1068978 RepID=A0A076MZ58_AMYME|nr:hypothetical protein [Amycolatopsis methanolica]AIJ22912.1 hypothetical protein AMETH_2820 [Amycolatopsis methanolica 239]